MEISAEFVFHIIDKKSLDVLATRAVVLGFVVKLEADDALVVLDSLHKPSDDTLGIKKIVSVCDIHYLACTIRLFAA